MGKIKGGCLCGQIRYQSDSKPLFTSICHCKHCQKQCGTAFSILIGVKKETLKITGEMSVYKDVGESGKPVFRKFCGKCGSPILSEVDIVPDLFFIKAGTLDNPTKLKPTKEIWTIHRLECVDIINDTDQFEYSGR